MNQICEDLEDENLEYEDLEEKKIEWNNFIAETYDKFKIFCNNYSLPYYDIKYTEIKEKCDYYMCVDTMARPSIILHINTKFMLKFPELIKQALYHEFTHIYDWVEFKKLKMLWMKKMNFFKLYTEYHAKQVELACVLNFNRINEYEQFSSRVKLPFYGSTGNLSVKQMCMAKAYRNSFLNEPNEKNLNKFIQFTFYYLGSRDICKNFCSIDNLWDTKYLEDFEEDFMEIANSFFNFKGTVIEINGTCEKIEQLKSNLKNQYN